jgi:hypothetical protein
MLQKKDAQKPRRRTAVYPKHDVGTSDAVKDARLVLADVFLLDGANVNQAPVKKGLWRAPHPMPPWFGIGFVGLSIEEVELPIQVEQAQQAAQGRTIMRRHRRRIRHVG